MKIIGYCPLHYGREYLAYSIRSVIDAIDELHILYAAQGSHGSRTTIPCPETRDELYGIASKAAGNKLRWHEGDWTNEGDQRMSIHQYAPDADLILALDADEVWGDGLAQEAIEFAQRNNVHTVRLPFIHLWRTFKRGFSHDPSYPTRVINPHIPGGDITMPTDKRVWHFGYCQSSIIVAYKTLTHGHRGEFRRDCNWIDEVFLANRQYDCHPVGSEYWNTEDLDLSQLPSVLRDHPYRNLELIP